MKTWLKLLRLSSTERADDRTVNECGIGHLKKSIHRHVKTGFNKYSPTSAVNLIFKQTHERAAHQMCRTNAFRMDYLYNEVICSPSSAYHLFATLS